MVWSLCAHCGWVVLVEVVSCLCRHHTDICTYHCVLMYEDIDQVAELI